jgi:hypothetical protein
MSAMAGSQFIETVPACLSQPMTFLKTAKQIGLTNPAECFGEGG